MPPRHEMIRLRADHAKLAQLADNLRRLAEAKFPPVDSALVEAQTALRDALQFHLKCEDWILYPAMMESPDPVVAATARRFKLEVGELAEEFARYMEIWSQSADAIADWPGFCVNTHRMLDMLDARTRRENEELYPMAEQAPEPVDAWARQAGRTGR